MELQIQKEIKSGIAIIHLQGEVDLYSSTEVRKEIMGLTRAKLPGILVDLQYVKYMDSSGVATLIEGLQQTNKYKGRFVLSGLQSNVREVFELTRLDKVFEIHADVNEALECMKT